MLSEKEKKLVQLALDPAAQPGEVATAALKLFESWRKRGLTLEELFPNGNSSIEAPAPIPGYWAPDYGLCVMPFGKHKGKEFKDIPPSYLRWLVSDMRENGTKYQNLLVEIERFLDQ